ncbi:MULTISPECIES: DUF1028 domain-containing protein [unclassified Mycolicibacterium]|uniref:DUF1028 domain-containing protein n=1 Tax=unclassified Mycolicibacterium TaxID=2636767 RepID=UPI001309E11C|nr:MULTISPECIES: DUF1028 domain-containing protein [unclassified Mycolicibacterium]MUL81300.1 DUF1028 domain-containing protein [Mycolicibacterium sp. CBMA 329]MUL87066.1 DUF1028 domain-containing protein [Mycolicibacterium sp. CBMA 331]MUL98652.1 DUF1028 domain-containing protein [Mycolicibacterium sp. CBMA 334]MUM28497.1 DUF1028 domain-containing protein [Mycolicibacterium sp. CBMA 295]MUM37363.1 DUF1028 domain-containing protein [Mycolicibacterium sp. CBMA 247]
MTLSLVVRDGAAFGMVVCSSSPAVASRCVHLRAGVGAVASQNVTNPNLGAVALDTLAGGADARTALEVTVAGEPHADYRQLIIVDRLGGRAIHTGAKALGIRHEAVAENAAAAGNMLADQHVIDALLRGYLTSDANATEQRLLDGLMAALAAGGEAGPVHSAGLQVVEDVPWPVTDLRVDWHDDPIGELHRLWEVWEPQKADYRTRGIDPTTAPSYGVPGDL